MRKPSWKTAVWRLLVGAASGFFLYPQAADWFTTRAQEGLVTEHTQELSALTAPERAELLADAEAFNERLFHTPANFTDETNPEYVRQLRTERSELMATVTLPTLDLTVPVHHGTTDEVLYRGAGHYYGTSLPVGGINTHAVITAHSALPNARLFTDLRFLTYGDVFFVSAAGRHVFYEVDQITVVLPGDYQEYLEIVPGADHVTLFTCTPHAINTHRLLVRGVRIPAPDNLDVLVQSHATLNAGIPWWAVIGASALLGGVTSGQMLLEPKQKPFKKVEPVALKEVEPVETSGSTARWPVVATRPVVSTGSTSFVAVVSTGSTSFGARHRRGNG